MYVYETLFSHVRHDAVVYEIIHVRNITNPAQPDRFRKTCSMVQSPVINGVHYRNSQYCAKYLFYFVCVNKLLDIPFQALYSMFSVRSSRPRKIIVSNLGLYRNRLWMETRSRSIM